jgi:hypothetical protein
MAQALIAPPQDELDALRSRIRGKACALVEVALGELYPILIDQETSAGIKLSILRDLSELGDLKPKKEAQVAAPGAGFSVIINIPGEPAKTLTLEGKPDLTSVEEAQLVEDDALPAMPSYITFELDNADLRGEYHA